MKLASHRTNREITTGRMHERIIDVVKLNQRLNHALNLHLQPNFRTLSVEFVTKLP